MHNERLQNVKVYVACCTVGLIKFLNMRVHDKTLSIEYLLTSPLQNQQNTEKRLELIKTLFRLCIHQKSIHNTLKCRNIAKSF